MLIKLSNCSFGYNHNGKRQIIVSDINFVIHPGETIILTGPNGSGKTTILKGIIGLSTLFCGSISFSLEKKKIGYVPQESEITPQSPATVLDILFLANPLNWGKSKEKAFILLDQIGLKELAHRKFSHLSGGQKRRVLTAHALMNDPKLILMDEPTAFTDRKSSSTIVSLVENYCKEKNAGLLSSSHSDIWSSDSKIIPLGETND